jgi:hypothetical protein
LPGVLHDNKIFSLPAEPDCPHGKHHDPDEENQQEHHQPVGHPVKYPEYDVQRTGDERRGNERAGQAFFCEALDV